MKNTCTLILLLSFIHTNAQVKFEKISLDAAIKKAALTGKLVFAQFESSTCSECNEVADIAFGSDELNDILSKKSIPIQIDIIHENREYFISKYNPRNTYGTFFITGDGELVHSFLATSSRHKEYLTQLEKAYSKITEGKTTLAELDKEWNNNPSNVTAMEANLKRRMSLGLSTDSLLEVYISRLPPDSFKSVRTLLFIASREPSLFSKAYSILRKDRELFNTAWYRMSVQQRSAFYNKVAHKSLTNAINEVNLGKANYVANFHAGILTDRNSTSAKKIHDKKMLDYFIGVKDTGSYLKKAVAYYETYYMNETDEQIRKADSLARNRAMQKSSGEAVKTNTDGNKITMRKSFTYAPVTQFFTRDLNSGAWLLYTSTTDKHLLEKAISWAKRAIQVYESPEAMDTYARLLYKTGDTSKATEWQEKAIHIFKARKRNTHHYEEVLSKMKEGKTVEN
jgi:tetratricopeptide (TPR) repeat protein